MLLNQSASSVTRQIVILFIMHHHIAVVLLVLVLGAHQSQQCHFEQIIDITNQYFAVMDKADDDAPISTPAEVSAALAVFDGMLQLVGIDGDVPWILNTIYVLISQKGSRLLNYVHYTLYTMDYYFYNTFLPEIRGVVGPFVYDAQIAAALVRYEQNLGKRNEFLINLCDNTLSNESSFLQQIASVILDINKRAVAQVQSGNYDVSAFEAEIKAYQSFLNVKGTEIAQGLDDFYGDSLKPLLDECMQISIGVQQRCIELLMTRCTV